MDSLCSGSNPEMAEFWRKHPRPWKVKAVTQTHAVLEDAAGLPILRVHPSLASCDRQLLGEVIATAVNRAPKVTLSSSIEAVRARLAAYESPLEAPPDYDPRCLCGGMIPHCPACDEMGQRYAERRERFHRHAADDLRTLLRVIDQMAAVLTDAS